VYQEKGKQHHDTGSQRTSAAVAEPQRLGTLYPRVSTLAQAQRQDELKTQRLACRRRRSPMATLFVRRGRG